MGAARRLTSWVGALAVGVAGASGSLALDDPLSVVAVGPVTPAHLARLNLGSHLRRTAPPEFSLSTSEGRTVSLAGLRGQVVLLNFWASWCLECRPEMPALETVHRRYGARGLAVVGVNTREPPTVVRDYAREMALTFPLVLDTDGAVAVRYGVIGLPTTFLIGRDGEVVAWAVGAREWRSPAAVEIIERLLAAPSVDPGRDRKRE